MASFAVGAEDIVLGIERYYTIADNIFPFRILLGIGDTAATQVTLDTSSRDPKGGVLIRDEFEITYAYRLIGRSVT